MEELIENPEEYGIYIVDRRARSVEDSVTQLTEQMFDFCQKTRRQRINQRNRTERLSDLLDWKRLGKEYQKCRQLALRRAYPDSFGEEDWDEGEDGQRVPRPMSAPGSPRFLSGLATPGDIGTLTEVSPVLRQSCVCTDDEVQEMQSLGTSDYMGNQTWESMMSRNKGADDEEEGYPFPLVFKKKGGSVSSGLASGQTTPGMANGTSAGSHKILSQSDLHKADEALRSVRGE